MRRKLSGWVVCSAVALAASMPARAIISNESPSATTTTAWDGVGALVPQLNGFAPATATLLDSTHLLTAAHAVYNGTTLSAVANGTFAFEIGNVNYSISSIAIAPGYQAGSDKADLAVITLSQPVTGHTTYGFNTGSINEVTEPTTLVGYGVSGTSGTTGTQPSTYPFGVERAADNAIDVNTDTQTYNPGSGTLPTGLLVYDFDNAAAGTSGPLGGPAIDANEGDTTDGDSGGPMFQLDSATGKYLITGVTVNGTTENVPYGDVSWGTRVSDYASFVESNVPEPTGLLPLGAVIFACRKRRRA